MVYGLEKWALESEVIYPRSQSAKLYLRTFDMGNAFFQKTWCVSNQKLLRRLNLYCKNIKIYQGFERLLQNNDFHLRLLILE